MTINRFKNRTDHSLTTAFIVCMFGATLAGCASMSDGMSSAFVDPAKYDLYNCVQLRTARTANAKRLDEIRGLMAKAETGTAGPIIAEVAYGNDYIATRAQSNLADEVWQRNHCDQAALPPDKPDPDSAAKNISNISNISTSARRKPSSSR